MPWIGPGSWFPQGNVRERKELQSPSDSVSGDKVHGSGRRIIEYIPFGMRWIYEAHRTAQWKFQKASGLADGSGAGIRELAVSL